MILEVIKNVRKQEYTPEKLLQLQKALEAKYFYWWIMDMKKEEYACELFSDNFTFHCGVPIDRNKRGQAIACKWCNHDIQTAHMGHQPMIWLIDDSYAQGMFQYENCHVYFDGGQENVREWMMYCDDFEKDDKGVRHITALRMAFRMMDGSFRDSVPPEGWIPEDWEEVKNVLQGPEPLGLV